MREHLLMTFGLAVSWGPSSGSCCIFSHCALQLELARARDSSSGKNFVVFKEKNNTSSFVMISYAKVERIPSFEGNTIIH